MYDINAYKCTLKCFAGSFHYVCSTSECLLWKAITINCSGNWVILLKHVTSSSCIQTRYVPFISSCTEFIQRNINIYPVLCPQLTLIQPMWSAYPYHLVFLIWYPYSLVFLIWYPYALTSLYGNTAHCSGYGIAMGCYGLFILPKTAIVTSQWYDRCCFTGYARTWARHPTMPWQRKCTAITSIASLLDSMQFVTHFWEIIPCILKDAIVG